MAAWRGLGLLRSSASWSCATRSLSVSSRLTAEQSVKAPIQVYGLEGRYAHALFSAASKKKSLESVEGELSKFHSVMEQSTTLSEFLANPTIRKQLKQAAVNQVLTDLKYSDLTKNLFAAMAENNRLTKVSSVIKAYSSIMRAHRGEVLCTVTTAKALDSKSLKEVETVLKGFLTAGQKLHINTKTDPSLIGGMIVDIGDKYIDMSTASKINKIVKSLQEGL